MPAMQGLELSPDRDRGRDLYVELYLFVAENSDASNTICCDPVCLKGIGRACRSAQVDLDLGMALGLGLSMGPGAGLSIIIDCGALGSECRLLFWGPISQRGTQRSAPYRNPRGRKDMDMSLARLRFSCSSAMAGPRVESWSRFLLLWLYRFARGLSLLSSNLDREKLQLKSPRQGSSNRILSILWRCLVVLIYTGVLPLLTASTVGKRLESYADLFAAVQAISVSILAVISFIIQAKGESEFREVLNRYLSLYQRICRTTRLQQLFPPKFVVFFLLKLFFTLCGCFHELIPLLQLEHFENTGRIVAVVFGIYMWLGTLFVLDACFLGFLVSGILYEHMAANIMAMLKRMEPIESPEEGSRLTHYRRMRLLCDFADELDECAAIYSELYEVTISFRRMLQWQILFYVYYNFINICLMLYEYILHYLNDDEVALVSLVMASVKLANLVLLIMCADYTVSESRKPQRLPLEIVCSDMDERWDKSVETFLGQLQTQRLEIKVLGFFHLNNEFILLILSAIISYLFILLQFGITGGFEASEDIKNQFD
ncbi:gustatory receptor for bitter taste 93a [Drosophila biarmipes]|uniref:gustatory receptor for bitter taste 93a n=1 Tax=Drosophila biarmipes TaxID=125945 RepID=UPI001CDB2A4F|nr:gustatory receptor for bitter taste 93a [Drosophila biarmipes]